MFHIEVMPGRCVREVLTVRRRRHPERQANVAVGIVITPSRHVTNNTQHRNMTNVRVVRGGTETSVTGQCRVLPSPGNAAFAFVTFGFADRVLSGVATAEKYGADDE